MCTLIVRATASDRLEKVPAADVDLFWLTYDVVAVLEDGVHPGKGMTASGDPKVWPDRPADDRHVFILYPGEPAANCASLLESKVDGEGKLTARRVQQINLAGYPQNEQDEMTNNGIVISSTLPVPTQARPEGIQSKRQPRLRTRR